MWEYDDYVCNDDDREVRSFSSLNEKPPTFFPGGNIAATKKAISMIGNSSALEYFFQEMYD